jgi:hypothetical protein
MVCVGAYVPHAYHFFQDFFSAKAIEPEQLPLEALMLEVAIMIEGQNGLTWPSWQRIVRSVEELGFAGLYRSDHFTNAKPPDRESLE